MTEHYRVRITMQTFDADTGDQLETLKVAEDSSPFPATLKQRVAENGGVALQILAQQLSAAAHLEQIRLDRQRRPPAPPPPVETVNVPPVRTVIAKPIFKPGPDTPR